MDKLLSIALLRNVLELGTNRDGYYHTTQISVADAEELYKYLHPIMSSRIATRQRLTDELKALQDQVASKKKELASL